MLRGTIVSSVTKDPAQIIFSNYDGRFTIAVKYYRNNTEIHIYYAWILIAYI